MNAMILNTSFETVGMIDVYESFIWTDRFVEHGDFEISIPIGSIAPTFVQKDYYVLISKSEHAMIIDTIGVEADVETGPKLLVSGKSLESILKRRIVYAHAPDGKVRARSFSRDKTTNVKPNLQNGIKTLLEENVINPTIAARKIPNFIFEESTDPAITELTFEAQYFGEDLYNIIVNLCKENDIGFKITLNELNQFVFKLIAGVDRSYSQDKNSYVIYSKKYSNIFNTQYIESNGNLKNVTLVAGEGEYDDDTEETDYGIYWLSTKDENNPDATIGLQRREIFTDATSLSTEDEDGDKLSVEQYQAQLRQKGIDTLMDNVAVAATDGEADTTRTYVYGKDYSLGDVVQIEDEYGHESRSRVTEMIFSCDTSGITAYPTFISIEKGVYE